jgi:hypothetical protein
VEMAVSQRSHDGRILDSEFWIPGFRLGEPAAGGAGMNFSTPVSLDNGEAQ